MDMAFAEEEVRFSLMQRDDASPRAALAAGIGCYLIWGFVPLVFQAIARLGVGPWETLAHRIVWSVPAAAALVVLSGQVAELRSVLRRPRTIAWLALSATLIAINWVVFISAVSSRRLIEASLGYYITPLVSMAAGAIVFHEKIDRIARIAVVFAAIGVAIQAAALGHVPWISLVLAASFGTYGIVRKRVAASAQVGFLVETIIVGTVATAWIVWLSRTGTSQIDSRAAVAWLIACGPITAIPLVLFAWAARRIPLSRMGFLQFLGPTISLVIGVVQGEPLTAARLLSFAFIWVGAAVFVYGALRRSRAVLDTPALVTAPE
jgi:chloramphenicol-sensitive protein RarD